MLNTDANHKHAFDEHGNIICCSLEDKLNIEANKKLEKKGLSKQISFDDLKTYLPSTVSFTLLICGIIFDHFIDQTWFKNEIRLMGYLLAYLPVALPVLKDTIKAFKGKDYFSEFFLMSIATIGAFSIGEYPEGVAVMLFYSVGELFQSVAVKKAKGSIKALLDIRPKDATVIRDGKMEVVSPETVSIGEIVSIKSGERIPLDGVLMSTKGSFNTAALTGESKPDTKYQNDLVLAGMINLGEVLEVKVTKRFSDSSISRILDLVQNATQRKAKTELLIRKFARIYTPIVVLLAVLLTLMPFIFVNDYIFQDWLYRALIFLVISCPCALVISIPLGYFGGIGAASRNGILFKGSSFLDLMANVNTVVMDKTGTLTKGIFKVQKIKSDVYSESDFIALVAAIEINSTHPIAKAIVTESEGSYKNIQITSVEEISGFGLQGKFNSEIVRVGNTKLLKKFNIAYPPEIDQISNTIVVVALGENYVGYITIADELKEDSMQAIDELKKLSLETIMLSGDKQAVVNDVAKALKIDQAYGDLLPQDKMKKVEELRLNPKKVIAFVGDGINDAPVLALSDVGIAMGGLGSDAAIETADVVIQTDHPSKIGTLIRIGKATKKIVWQNIALAFGVKLIVLALGAGGIATMWEAVFADVGVALLAILNAARIQRFKFR